MSGRRRSGDADPRRGSSHRRSGGVSRRGRGRCRARPRRSVADVRQSSRKSPETGYGYIKAGDAIGSRGASRRAVRGEAGCRYGARNTSRRAATSGTAACSCSRRARTSTNSKRTAPTSSRLCRECRPDHVERSRLQTSGRRVRKVSVRVDRLRGHGEDASLRRAADQRRLERRRFVEGAVGSLATRCRRQSHSRRRRHGRHVRFVVDIRRTPARDRRRQRPDGDRDC